MLDRDAVVRALRESADALLPHFAAPAADLDKSYGPGKWTVRQILAHLADCEAMNLTRFLYSLSEPGFLVTPFDENKWAAALEYQKRPAPISRGLFQGARAVMIAHLESASAEAIERAVKHPEKGTVSALHWGDINARHTRHHLEQVIAARAGKLWTPSPKAGDKDFGATQP